MVEWKLVSYPQLNVDNHKKDNSIVEDVVTRFYLHTFFIQGLSRSL